MVFADIYLQPDAPDPVLDEQTIVAAARRHVPDAGRLLAVDESGGEARAYFLEGDLVVKTQRPHRLRPRTSLAKEAFFLNELHRCGDFPVPHVLGQGELRGTEYLCLTRIAGAALSRTNLDPGGRRRALTELGRTLRAIHDIDQAALDHSELMPGDREPADLRARIADTFARLAT
ncbi:phosphotransferase, partial [Acidimicrobiaceae bacterium USS-CC1]|nr:phosphotransferase [Acidiferrimicrobium australe]